MVVTSLLYDRAWAPVFAVLCGVGRSAHEARDHCRHYRHAKAVLPEDLGMSHGGIRGSQGPRTEPPVEYRHMDTWTQAQNSRTVREHACYSSCQLRRFLLSCLFMCAHVHECVCICTCVCLCKPEFNCGYHFSGQGPPWVFEIRSFTFTWALLI